MASVIKAMMLVAVATGTAAHEWGLGRCPRVEPVPNLSVDKFLGVWYVMEQFDTSSHCLLLNYTRVSETQLKVTKVRQFRLLDQVGLDHTNSYTGTLDLPNENDLARMRVKWPLNVAGKGDYIVFDTDYTTYGAVYECQAVTPLLHRQSAAILSRTRTLRQEYVDKVKGRLKSFDVDSHDFDVIAHVGCANGPRDTDINIHIDGDTLRNVVNTTRSGLEDAATTVFNSITDLASTVSQVAQDTFGTGTLPTVIHVQPNTNFNTNPNPKDTLNRTGTEKPTSGTTADHSAGTTIHKADTTTTTAAAAAAATTSATKTSSTTSSSTHGPNMKQDIPLEATTTTLTNSSHSTPGDSNNVQIKINQLPEGNTSINDIESSDNDINKTTYNINNTDDIPQDIIQTIVRVD